MSETRPMHKPARPLRVVQFSDCHVTGDPDGRYRGIDPRATLECLLEAAAAWRPDLLLATGDLSEDASAASYRYLAEQFSRLGVPVLTLPGNHDEATVQQAHFPACPVDTPLLHEAGGWQFVLLNSVVPDRVPGRLSDRMLESLEKVLAGDRGRPRIVLLHHQPVPVRSGWIDRYPLEQPEHLWSVLETCPDVRAVAWGHIHHAYTARRNGMWLLGAPSTAINSLAQCALFSEDSRGPACRWLKLEPRGGLFTGVLRDGRPLSRGAAITRE